MILKAYLDDNFDFDSTLPFSDIERIVAEIRAIYKDFSIESKVGLDNFADLCLFFMRKAKDRKFVRFTKIKDFDFYRFLEQALETESHQFAQYMLYLKKNQEWVIVDDFIKIMVRFKVISLPFARDLELNPTSGSLKL